MFNCFVYFKDTLNSKAYQECQNSHSIMITYDSREIVALRLSKCMFGGGALEAKKPPESFRDEVLRKPFLSLIAGLRGEKMAK